MVRLVELCLNPKFMLAEFQRLPWLPSCGHPPHGGMMGTSGTGPPHPPPLTWVPVRGLLWLGLATQNRPFYLALKSSKESHLQNPFALSFITNLCGREHLSGLHARLVGNKSQILATGRKGIPRHVLKYACLLFSKGF
jgi:hypothetical protein